MSTPQEAIEQFLGEVAPAPSSLVPANAEITAVYRDGKHTVTVVRTTSGFHHYREVV